MNNKRIWVITGISSGLGKSIAKAVIQSGDFVIGTFRQQSQVNDFNTINQGKAFSYLLDISNHNTIDFISSEITDQFGQVDVLVNNAGIGFTGAIEETSIEETRTVFESNFFGTLKMTKAFLPIMREQKSGHIIQISSHGGMKAFAGFGIYNASKFALEGFSEALAQEVNPLGIKVTIVEPGPFRTNFAGASLKSALSKIADYNDTANAFDKKLRSVSGIQEGDPDKAALAIMSIVNQEKPPLRLPLGKIPLLTIQSKIDSVQKDLESNRKVAEEAVYED